LIPVHRIRLPFHLELDHVNVFLVPDGKDWILVDAGFGTDECFAALEAGLHAHQVEWRQIKTLLVTHCHPDHIGLAHRILEKTGARLLMHRAEMEFLAYIANIVDRPEALDGRMLSWGTPAEMVERISRTFRAVRLNFRELKADRLLDGGEMVGPLQTIWTPGHAPGHLCLYIPGDRVLISGDHVLKKITPHIAWTEGRDVLGEYLDSLERIAAFDVVTVHPSHGDPFEHLRERTREIALHHDWRCETIRQAIRDGAGTPHQIVEKVWKNKLSPFQHRFALFEVMAHVEYMRRRGNITLPWEEYA
jgi:glyoxylase-like metal-dependent hydrolase (beta-lactamase superfamily II)